jgi:pilus assembly protein CpaC
MGLRRILRSLFLVAWMGLTPAGILWAQEEVPLSSTTEATPKSAKRQFLTLTVGIEQDIKIEQKLPSTINFKGDYSKFLGYKWLPDQKILRLSPRSPGDATITIHDASGKTLLEFPFVVKISKLNLVAKEIQSLLGDIEGIQIKIVNDKVIVDGQILLTRDMNRIYNVISQYGDQAASLVVLSPIAQKKIAEFIARDINNPEIEVRAVNDKFILQGFASSEDEKNRAEIIAKTYIPAVVLDKAEQDKVVLKPKAANDGVINLIVVKAQPQAPPAKTIQLVVHYVELSKDYTKGFRFQFMPSLNQESGVTFSTGSNQGGGIVSSITGTISNLLPKLNWAKEHGYARVLESVSLIVQDGRKGVINSTQSQPYQTASATGAPVTSFIDVGIATSITPAILGERSDSISLEMDFEISALTGQTRAGPQTSKNKINTMIVVRSGQSAAVGGLITNRSVTGYNRLPAGVDANPILSLYASKDFSRGQSQFVVFVTPSIKSSASAGSEKIKKKFRLAD